MHNELSTEQFLVYRYVLFIYPLCHFPKNIILVCFFFVLKCHAEKARGTFSAPVTYLCAACWNDGSLAFVLCPISTVTCIEQFSYWTYLLSGLVSAH